MQRYARGGPVLLLLLASLALTSCAEDPTSNLPQSWRTGVERLGIMYAQYPLQERMRSGQLYLIDDGMPYNTPFPRRYLLSDALVPYFEAARRDAMARNERLEWRSLPSRGNGGSGAGAGGAGGGGAAGSGTGAGAGNAAQSENPLGTISLPSYSIATHRDFMAAASVPMQVVNALFGGSLREGSLISLEIDAVEESELSLQDIYGAIYRGCTEIEPGATAPVLRGISPEVMRQAVALLGLQREALSDHQAELRARGHTIEIGPANPSLMLITTVYYLRGITYVRHMDRAAIAQFQAAFAAPTATPGAQSRSIHEAPEVAKPTNAFSVTINDKGDGNGAGANVTQQQAALIRQEVASAVAKLAETINSRTNASVAARTTYVTARGFEQKDTFERPMAFGFNAIWYNPEINEICGEGRPRGPMTRPIDQLRSWRPQQSPPAAPAPARQWAPHG